jgi:flagellar protein FlaH
MQTTISDLTGDKNRQIIPMGNHLPDKEIADALPLWSLTPIEGENETGKSVLTRQTVHGAMKPGISVDLFTTGNTTNSFIRQMESISRDVAGYFARGYLRVFPHDVVDFKWIRRDKAYSLATDRRHQAKHGAGGDHLTLWDRVERIWPAQL